MDDREIITRLRTGWRPSGRDLADAALIERWSVDVIARGPYVLHGRIAGRMTLAVLIAIDADVGWARACRRWLVLGEPGSVARRFLNPDEVMRRAAGWMLLRGPEGNC
ncbi:MAG: hypothetical protein HY659_00535 [Rhizobiales bacterium]|nr:hypothetical protein [Hyphomicrobiales bacterium]